MLNNLFSMFDNKNYIFSLSYIMVMFLFYFMFNFIMLNSLVFLGVYFLNWCKTFIFGNPFLLISFVVVSTYNYTSLNSYNFCLSSQFSHNMVLVLGLIVPLLMMTLLKKNNSFLCHLIPISTPNMLAPMMVLIELISFLIRPLTLFLRLTINMIAGHVLITLLSNSLLLNFNFFLGMTIYLYMMLKFMVSFIQSYIISTLVYMYMEEI